MNYTYPKMDRCVTVEADIVFKGNAVFTKPLALTPENVPPCTADSLIIVKDGAVITSSINDLMTEYFNKSLTNIGLGGLIKDRNESLQRTNESEIDSLKCSNESLKCSNDSLKHEIEQLKHENEQLKAFKQTLINDSLVSTEQLSKLKTVIEGII